MDKFGFQEMVGPSVVVAKVAISDKHIERVVAQIEERYGFTPTDLYVRDLITFVTELSAIGAENSGHDVTEMTHNEPRE